MRKALLDAGRGDLFGSGCDALIPAQPPKEALTARREHANETVRGDYVHQMPKRGDRPARQAQTRQAKPGRNPFRGAK